MDFEFNEQQKAIKVTSRAIQIQGAYALSQDNGLQRVFRDARMMTISGATSQIHQMIVGRDLLQDSAFV